MGRLRSPVIPILLKGRKTFWTNALVDTGADTSVLTKKVAEILELDLSAKPQKVNGIGGETEAVLTVFHSRERGRGEFVDHIYFNKNVE